MINRFMRMLILIAAVIFCTIGFYYIGWGFGILINDVPPYAILKWVVGLIMSILGVAIVALMNLLISCCYNWVLTGDFERKW